MKKTILTILALIMLLPGCALQGRQARMAVVFKIRDQLVSPSTADFYGVPQFEELSTNRYRVWGAVDSQNLYGAFVRTHFSVVATYYPDQDRWMFTEWDLR